MDYEEDDEEEFGDIEAEVGFVEGFSVRVTGSSWGPVSPEDYLYERKAPSKWTVSHWKKTRFEKCFPGLDVIVIDQDGYEAKGNMILENVREQETNDFGVSREAVDALKTGAEIISDLFDWLAERRSRRNK